MGRDVDELIATRTTLIAKLKDWQDESSWQAFFDCYWQLIYGVARKSGLTTTEAQDVVQETMISVARHMPNFNYDRSTGSFRTWLLNLTRWRISDQLRRRVRAPSRPNDAEPATGGTSAIDRIVDPTVPGLKAIWDREWEKNLAEAALSKVKRKVDPARYQIFDFYVNKGWSPEKVAAACGVKVDQVYLAKHRITEMIKEEMACLEAQLA
jgi:RNA polymerase sigma-70 factor (ECF subfamily)